MKKSTLLSLLTATSIVLTSAGTYAAWDSITDNTTASVSFRKPVTVTVGDSYTLSEQSPALGTVPTVSGNVQFTVENDGGVAKKLKLTPKISGGNGASLEDFDITITGVSEDNGISGNASEGFTDTSLDSTNYTVTVKAKDGTQSKVSEAVNIGLTATLE